MKRHKYFRNLRHKQKLEAKVGTNHTYWSHVYFITEDPDPKYERECNYRFLYYSRGREVDSKATGKDYYIYYDRPEIPYTILKVHTKGKYSKLKSYYKRYSNRIVRQCAKQKHECYNNGQYKKQFDLKWTLD